MAKVIQQETFDDAVRENIVEFAMSIVEAKEETIEQFEKQGINLSNIIKNLSINENTGTPLINEAVEQLKLHISGQHVLKEDQINSCLYILKTECNKSVPHRVLASSIGSAKVLLTIIDNELNAREAANYKVILSYLKSA